MKFVVIDVQVGCIGVIMLVVCFELVFVGGVIVINVMLYNEDEVCCKDIWIGDIVIVCCVGDVILEVVGVLFDWCLVDVVEFVMLIECLVCGLKIECLLDEVIVCCIGGLFCLVQCKQVLWYFV